MTHSTPCIVVAISMLLLIELMLVCQSRLESPYNLTVFYSLHLDI